MNLYSQNSSYKSVFVFVALLSLLNILVFIIFSPKLLEFNAAAISNGEFYRVVTAHLIHQNIWHLLLNVAGLIIVSVLFAKSVHPKWQGLLLPFQLMIITGILWAVFDYTYYLGLSAYLHALFAFALVFDLIHKRPYSRWLLGGLIGKLAIEMLTHDNSVNSTIGIEIAVESHLVGSIVGAVFGVIVYYMTKKRVHTQ